LEVGSYAELPFADAPPQAIIAQSPAAGATGVTSPRVSLLYAGAPPDAEYVMPDLTGMTLSDATALVAASGLKVISAASNSAAAAPKIGSVLVVVGQSPAAGSRVTPGTAVNFQIVHY
jgi:beta-lactam-binding protein with PASTA domain